MDFTSYFEHPTKGVYSYSFQGKTLKDEEREARGFDGMGEFGTFLYSRPIAQVLIRTGQRYNFKFNRSLNQFRYKLAEHRDFGKFDYYQADANGVLTFSVIHKLEIPELRIKSDVCVKLQFEAAFSGKFTDFLTTHSIAVEFADGGAHLYGYQNENSEAKLCAVELKILR